MGVILFLSNIRFIDNVPTRDEWEVVIDSQRILEGQKPELTVHPVLTKYITAFWISCLSEKVNDWIRFRTLPWIVIGLSLLIYIKAIILMSIKESEKYFLITLFLITYMTSPLLAGFSTIIEIDPFLCLIFSIITYILLVHEKKKIRDSLYLIYVLILLTIGFMLKYTTMFAIPISIIMLYIYKKNYKLILSLVIITFVSFLLAKTFNASIIAGSVVDNSSSYLTNSFYESFVDNILLHKVNSFIALILLLNPFFVLITLFSLSYFFLCRRTIIGTIKVAKEDYLFLVLIATITGIGYFILDPGGYSYFPKHFNAVFMPLSFTISLFVFEYAKDELKEFIFKKWILLSVVSVILLLLLGFYLLGQDPISFVNTSAYLNNLRALLINYLLILLYYVLLFVLIIALFRLHRFKITKKAYVLILFITVLSSNTSIWIYQRIANNYDLAYSYGQNNNEYVYQLISQKANEGYSILSDYDFFRYHSYVSGLNTAYNERVENNYTIIKSIKMDDNLSAHIQDINVFRKNSLKKYGKSGPYKLYMMACDVSNVIFENNSFVVLKKIDN